MSCNQLQSTGPDLHLCSVSQEQGETPALLPPPHPRPQASIGQDATGTTVNVSKQKDGVGTVRVAKPVPPPHLKPPRPRGGQARAAWQGVFCQSGRGLLKKRGLTPEGATIPGETHCGDLATQRPKRSEGRRVAGWPCSYGAKVERMGWSKWVQSPLFCISFTFLPPEEREEYPVRAHTPRGSTEWSRSCPAIPTRGPKACQEPQGLLSFPT